MPLGAGRPRCCLMLAGTGAGCNHRRALHTDTSALAAAGWRRPRSVPHDTCQRGTGWRQCNCQMPIGTGGTSAPSGRACTPLMCIPGCARNEPVRCQPGGSTRLENQ